MRDELESRSRVILALRDLVKTRGQGGDVFELRVAELEFETGSVTAIVGESGSGKSTLLDILSLASRPDRVGAFAIADGQGAERDIAALWRRGDEAALAVERRRAGYVPQTGGLLPWLSVWENAALGDWLALRAPNLVRIHLLAQRLGLTDKLAAAPSRLSGGERQRAAILRAFAHRPRLVLADEPTAAVDRPMARRIMAEFAALAAQGDAAAVVVSHDAELVAGIAGRVYRMSVERLEDGRCVAVCARDEALDRISAAPLVDAAEALDVAAPAPRPAAGWRAGLRSLHLVARLAWRSFAHEPLLSATLVSAMAAIVAPLLLLLGLKFGVVEHHMTRLTEDPAFREIRPDSVVEAPPELIDAWRARADVAFVTPGIARGASAVALELDGVALRLDLAPTLPGDPLIAENGAPAPGDGEIVLSHDAALQIRAELGAEGDLRALLVGRRADLRVGRRIGGRRAIEDVAATIAGVLDPRADPLSRVYAPFGLVEAVELYRGGEADSVVDGRADTAPAPAAFDAVLAIRPSSGGGEIDAERLARAASAVGAVLEPDEAEARALLGVQPADGDASPLRARVLRAPSATLSAASLSVIAAALAEDGPILAPLVDPIPARFEVDGGGGGEMRIIGAPDAALSARLGVAPVFTAPGADGAVALALPADLAPLGARGRLIARVGGRSIAAPAHVAAHVAAGALVPMTIASQLNTGRTRPIAFDAETGDFRLQRRGYRDFRLYARSIEDVEALHQDLTAAGLSVASQHGAIQTVLEMRAALGKLFWLVAVVGIGGAVAAVAASLVSSVERRREEIGVLRLIGLGRGGVYALPVLQANIVAVLSIGLASAAFFALAAAINASFADQLPFGQKLCLLPITTFPIALALAMAVASMCATAAARRAVRIDPVGAIRRE